MGQPGCKLRWPEQAQAQASAQSAPLAASQERRAGRGRPTQHPPVPATSSFAAMFSNPTVE